MLLTTTPSVAAYPIRLMPRGTPAGASNQVALNQEIQDILGRDPVVAIGASGGKDSIGCALAVAKHLDAIGHRGPRVLIHADLGRVEWKDSLPSCQRLAAYLGWELIVVRRKAGDMLARWQGRWANNLARYKTLQCVKLILPWSTPSMRFCTSELKVAVIASALKKRFPGQDIVNVTGVRREESATRAKMPVTKAHAGLTRKDAAGLTWNAIIDWPVQDVLYAIDDAGLALHEAYRVYAASRVSCVYCIMSVKADLQAGVSCTDNHAVYRQMVELEAESAFAFQDDHWLADIAPHLLSANLQAQVAIAKAKASARQAIEGRLPKHLLYVDGWPLAVPSLQEAELIADVRREVAALMQIPADYLTAPAVRARYAELLALKAVKADKKAKKQAKTLLS